MADFSNIRSVSAELRTVFFFACYIGKKDSSASVGNIEFFYPAFRGKFCAVLIHEVRIMDQYLGKQLRLYQQIAADDLFEACQQIGSMDRFDRSVDRQKVGLIGNVVYRTDPAENIADQILGTYWLRFEQKPNAR